MTITRTTLAALIVALGLGVGLAPVAIADPAGDDSTTVQEDQPGWDCRINGNQICGPGNAQGAAPGQYANGVYTGPVGLPG